MNQKGFSPEYMKRMEKVLMKRAMETPALPPEVAMQVSNAIALAVTKAQFSNMQFALGTSRETAVTVRVLVFKDTIGMVPNALAVAPSPDLGLAPEPVAPEELAREAAEREKEYEVVEPKEGE
jgi:hypothetical protein